jgi:hypothetical protein
MDDDQHAQCHAQADQDEALLTGGVIRIGKEDGIFIGEYRFGLVEADTVFRQVRPRPCRVPDERTRGSW